MPANVRRRSLLRRILVLAAVSVAVIFAIKGGFQISALTESRRAAQDCGRRAAAALAKGDIDEARRSVGELQRHSERLARCLDQFTRDYLGTFMQQGTSVQTRAAA